MAAKTKTNTEPAPRTPNKANYTLDIDFNTGMSAQDITSERAKSRGLWPNKLQALLDGIEAGHGEPGVFYKLGEFTTPSGARTVIKEFEKHPEKLPASFDMEARLVRDAEGKRTSELWAAVPADDEPEAD